MNKVILMGRLTRDPDVRYSNGGPEGSMCIARFTVAVDRRRTGTDGKREADFIGCVAFGRQGEFVEKYLHTGTKIALTGRIQTGNYEKQDGTKVYTTDVVAEDIEFAESKASQDQRTGGYVPQQSSAGYRAPNTPAPTQEPAFNQQNYAPAQPSYDDSASRVGQGFMNIPEGVDDEGLPFN
ncbi:MAG: single-stranded DNA-binding protein [Eubacteriales bacterium]|nr:single-stranded DNA-binding protein [Eubacteriales bacterium]